MAKLFYIIGASGVGKDSLINFSRRHIRANAPIMFAHRYITRAAEAGGENHIALTEAEFKLRKECDCFSMCWQSHNTWYGIGTEIDQWLSTGVNVVVNGSRGYLSEACKQYPKQLTPVLITASTEQLKSRLIARGRESAAEIESRLAQAMALSKEIDHPELVEIRNDGSLAEAGGSLIRLFSDQWAASCA